MFISFTLNMYLAYIFSNCLPINTFPNPKFKLLSKKTFVIFFYISCTQISLHIHFFFQFKHLMTYYSYRISIDCHKPIFKYVFFCKQRTVISCARLERKQLSNNLPSNEGLFSKLQQRREKKAITLNLTFWLMTRFIAVC